MYKKINYKKKGDGMSVESKENLPETKLRMDIYVPLNLCACMYEHFLNQVFSTIMEYTRLINFETKSLESNEAKQLNLHGNCVVLDGKTVIIDPYQLRTELPRLLKEKGLLQK